MRSALIFVLACAMAAGGPPLTKTVSAAAQGQVVDRIVARIEDDVITLSEVHELAAYQRLVDGKSEPDSQLVSELTDQWIINNEAQTAQYPQPEDVAVDRQVQQIQGRFPTASAFSQRLASLGLTLANLRRLVMRQIYLTSYLDYRFRPAVQVDDEAVAKYYRETLAPQLESKQQNVPPLGAVTNQIRELLSQQAINDRSGAWLSDTRGRLQIEIEPEFSQAENQR